MLITPDGKKQIYDGERPACPAFFGMQRIAQYGGMYVLVEICQNIVYNIAGMSWMNGGEDFSIRKEGWLKIIEDPAIGSFLPYLLDTENRGIAKSCWSHPGDDGEG